MDEGWGWWASSLKINFLLMDKVFAITESSGHFIFCLNEVHHIFVVGWWVGTRVGGIPKISFLSCLQIPSFGGVVIVILIVTG